MRRNRFLLLALCFIISKSYSQTYIQNVSVLDVVNKKVIPKQTVIISNGLISGIQSAPQTKIPADAEVINGEGKFLLPGLTDAHVHFFQSGGLYTRPDVIDLRKFQSYENEIAWVHSNMEDLLRRYVQNGITSVIDVGAPVGLLQKRNQFRNHLLTPTVFMSGPLLTSYEPEVFKNLLPEDKPFTLIATAEEGVKGVRDQLPHRPDLVKIWYIVDDTNKDSIEISANRFLPVLKAVIEEAHNNNLRVAVHATQQFPARLAVENGCDYLVHGIDDEVVSDGFVRLLKSKNVILCPTLIVEDNYFKTLSQTQDYSFYDLAKSNPVQVGSIEDLKHLSDTATINQYKRFLRSEAFVSKWGNADSIRKMNLKKLAGGGVIIAAGTDAGNIGTQHATSFYNELLAMKEAGLTNWEIIQSATINPAKILNHQNSTGSIATGKTADLILLDANPVDSIQHIRKINLVINKGHVINPDTLIATTPETLVQQQLNAYNAGNIEAFLEPYADDVELYNFPDKLLGRGKEIMRQQYGAIFKQFPNLHCEIKGRIANGNTVIDLESISGLGQTESMKAIAIYEVKDGKIIKVYFKE